MAFCLFSVKEKNNGTNQKLFEPKLAMHLSWHRSTVAPVGGAAYYEPHIHTFGDVFAEACVDVTVQSGIMEIATGIKATPCQNCRGRGQNNGNRNRKKGKHELDVVYRSQLGAENGVDRRRKVLS